MTSNSFVFAYSSKAVFCCLLLKQNLDELEIIDRMKDRLDNHRYESLELVIGKCHKDVV